MAALFMSWIYELKLEQVKCDHFAWTLKYEK